MIGELIRCQARVNLAQAAVDKFSASPHADPHLGRLKGDSLIGDLRRKRQDLACIKRQMASGENR